jgi:type IV pilus biogenesis protein CpaD/CtpE
MRNQNVLLRVALAGVALSLLAGCDSKSDAGKTVSAAPDQVRARENEAIARIQNNPNMPPAAKASAIAAVKRGQESARNMGQPPPPPR